MQILIVDNNVEFCQVLLEYLNDQLDFTVIGVAHDGEAALVKIEELEPDVVIMDNNIPYLDGIGVLERLRTLELIKKPRILVTTAFGNDNILRQFSALGADYFLIKPFHLKVLVERIKLFSQKNGFLVLNESVASLEGAETQEQKVTKILHSMGVPSHYKGFTYLREAVLMYSKEDYISGGLTKEMYPELAKKYKTTGTGVEAAIRNAVVAAWQNGNVTYIKNLCNPHGCERMPTNSLIIAKIAEQSKSM